MVVYDATMLYHAIISDMEERKQLVEERQQLVEERLTEQINELKKENTQLKQRSNRGTAETMW